MFSKLRFANLASENWVSLNNVLTLCSASQSNVITVNGTLNGKLAKMLLDSGASGNFIKKSFIDETSENLFDDLQLVNDKNVKLADGSIIKTNLACQM